MRYEHGRISKADNSAFVEEDYLVHGTAKAWANFNGAGAIAIRQSLNCSSLTDIGTGNYRVSFTASMANGDHAPQMSGDMTETGGVGNFGGYASEASAGSLATAVSNNSSYIDSDQMWAATLGDLAT